MEKTPEERQDQLQQRKFIKNYIKKKTLEMKIAKMEEMSTNLQREQETNMNKTSELT